MITYLGVLNVINSSTEDFVYKTNVFDIIDMKYDIENACRVLNISKPITIDEAKLIADYINK